MKREPASSIFNPDPGSPMNAPKLPSRSLLLFGSSDHAFWAEEVAQGQDIPVELGPAPPGAGSKCGLALSVDTAHAPQLIAALRSQGVEFQLPSP